VIFPVVAERETGFRRYRITDAEVAAQFDVLIPFVASIRTRASSAFARRAKLIENLASKGFKIHPTMQGFYPNDRSASAVRSHTDGGAIAAVSHPAQTGLRLRYAGWHGMRLIFQPIL